MGRQVGVDVFTRAEAVSFLLERSGRSEDPAAAELAAELGDLALALAQASAYIADQHLTFAVYLDRLRGFPLEDYLPRVRPTATPQAPKPSCSR